MLFEAVIFVGFLEPASVFYFQSGAPGGVASVVILLRANFEVEPTTQETRKEFFLSVLEFLLRLERFLVFGLLCVFRTAGPFLQLNPGFIFDRHQKHQGKACCHPRLPH